MLYLKATVSKFIRTSMPYRMEVTFEGDYVLVISEGEKTLENITNLWKEIARLCHEVQCFKVLGIGKSDNPLSVNESFDHTDSLKKIGITNKFKVAWTDTNPEAYATLNLLEAVFRRQGIANGRIFADVHEAKKWLLDD
ncbi:MAG TPA: hypothetical protein ENJ60_15845 [Aeromonadales bacterium]|nr:hypothetical protein [Aeromonadales bacterium]